MKLTSRRITIFAKIKIRATETSESKSDDWFLHTLIATERLMIQYFWHRIRKKVADNIRQNLHGNLTSVQKFDSPFAIADDFHDLRINEMVRSAVFFKFSERVLCCEFPKFQCRLSFLQDILAKMILSRVRLESTGSATRMSF